MLTVLLILALLGTLALVFHISLELNSLEKSITALMELIQQHYEKRDTD